MCVTVMEAPNAESSLPEPHCPCSLQHGHSQQLQQGAGRMFMKPLQGKALWNVAGCSWRGMWRARCCLHGTAQPPTATQSPQGCWTSVPWLRVGQDWTSILKPCCREKKFTLGKWEDYNPASDLPQCCFTLGWLQAWAKFLCFVLRRCNQTTVLSSCPFCRGAPASGSQGQPQLCWQQQRPLGAASSGLLLPSTAFLEATAAEQGASGGDIPSGCFAGGCKSSYHI